MKSNRGLIILCAPAFGATLLVAALAFRSSPDLPAPRTAASRSSPRDSRVAPSPAGPVARPAPEHVVARATDEVRVRSTYQNYRTAVATGNRVMQEALRPLVLRHRDVALRLAHEDLARASSELDREVARKTLDGLKR